MKRRLAAIVVADLVGYSRLMARNETETVRRFARLRADVVEPAVTRHGGRIFKSMGDALLVEFASVVDAVSCALDIRMAMHAVEARGVDALAFRVGIHAGDVIVEGDDLLGDGVNVAARIQAEAEPDAIFISEDAARHIRGKVEAALEDLGARRLKNLPEPVRLFRVVAGTEPRTRPQAAVHDTGLSRLAVKPLRHLGDAAQAHIADGLGEALTAALTLFDHLTVIAWTPEEGSDAADYVLEGSVQTIGRRARIGFRLAESTSGRHVWAHGFDLGTDDPFALQDEVVAVIASAVPEAIPAEAARALEGKPEADYTVGDWLSRGLHHLHRIDPEGCRSARACFAEARAIAPDLQRIRMLDAYTHLIELMNGWPVDRADALDHAIASAHEVLRDNPRNATALRLLATLCRVDGRLDEALAHIRRAYEINPFDSDIILSLGGILVATGDVARGVERLERACAMNPYAPTYYVAYLALAYYLAGRAPDALDRLRGLARPVGSSSLTLAATLVRLGREDEARTVMRSHLATHPEACLATIRERLPLPKDAAGARYLDDLRAAGCPELAPLDRPDRSFRPPRAGRRDGARRT